MERPLWVQIGLWGLKTRSVVIAFIVLSIAVAIGLCVLGFWWGALLLLAAAWYFFAMRWVDKNEGWE